MSEIKNKDAYLKKILAELRTQEDEPELTPEQEELFRYATDPDFKFQKDLENIFDNQTTKES